MGLSLLPHTVTFAPSSPDSLISCRAFSRSGAAFGSPHGQGSISSYPGMVLGRKLQAGWSRPPYSREMARLSTAMLTAWRTFSLSNGGMFWSIQK